MNYAAVARRITRTLFAAQSLASAATVAVFPVTTIVGARLSGHPSWAGVPSMAYMLGTALSAFVWGQLMDRLGRRATLILGLLLGSLGGLTAAAAIQQESFPLFLLGSILIGVAVSAVQLSRFVAAEVHPPTERARAISTVVLGGTVGGIAGPLLGGQMGRLAGATGLDELAGPYLITLTLFILAAVIIFALLRPEPREIGRALAAANRPDVERPGPARGISELLRVPAVVVAMAAMVFGQMVMTMLMVITPLHMRGHDHALSSISYVISGHVVGMYAFSVISGRLADRWGRGQVIITGALILVLACAGATLSPEVVPLTAALFLLGLGWNFCYVAGSSLLSDQLSPGERARTQGFNDLLIGLTSATGGLGSGIVFAAIGYATMAVVGAVVSLVPLTLATWWQLRSRVAAVAGAAK